MSGFKIVMRIEGSARTVETAYGPREQRDDVSQFELEVAPARAFKIFQDALSAAIAPDMLITFPDDASKEQRAEWITRWQEQCK